MSRLDEVGIGGDLELDPDLLLESIEGEPTPGFDGVLCDSGRNAIALSIEHLRDAPSPPTVFLLPAYLCASMLQPFVAAGVETRFYPVGRDLEPDVSAIAALARDERACVLVVDYFGFPPSPAAAEALRSLDARVVEDAAHGSLVELDAPAAGSIGDLVLTSFRKFAPVPDGALARGNGLDADRLADPDGRLVLQRLVAKLMRFEHRMGGPAALEPAVLALVDAHEAALDANTHSPARMSDISRRLLSRLDLAAAAHARRANFLELLSVLDGSTLSRSLVPLYGSLPAGVSPLTFPVRVRGDRRDALRRELIRRKVYCAVHWALPPAVPRDTFGAEAELSEEVLSLPLDQRYEPLHMRELAVRLAAAVGAIR
jgi:dTDP-4-amino-4,6-dideoxygalactose transaminase